MKTITIIDTFGFFFRSFYALPNLRSSDGFPTGLLTGFANFIYTIEKDFPSEYILFALDSKGKTFRHDIDPNYKANRVQPPEDLLKQLPVAIDWIQKMGFKEYSKDGYEADDVIASMVKFAKDNDIKVRIVTHDKDLYQLIDDGRVVIFDPLKKREINEDGCVDKFGLPPSKIRDYLAFAGDSADNIPGVKGIGPKGAKKLLDEFDNLENIYQNIDKIRNPRTKELLVSGKENAFISHKLTALDDSLDVYEKLENFKFPSINPLYAIKEHLAAKGMRQILNKIGEKEPLKQDLSSTFKPILLDTKEKLFEVVNSIPNDAIVAIDTETNSLDSRSAKIVGYSFCFSDDKAFYVPISHFYLGVGEQVSKEDARLALKKILKRNIVGQNLKFDLNIIENNFGLKNVTIYADTMILAWLLNSDLNVGMDSIAKRFLNHETIKFNDVVAKNATFDSVDIESACKYASEDAWVTLKLFNRLKELIEPAIWSISKSVEFPFIEVLRDMENEGIKIDMEHFETLLKTSEEVLQKLTKDIYILSGCEFNINSSMQLGVVLFEELKLKATKKTKTGYSTDENVLNELKEEHPVISKLLNYREMFKLKSTYIAPLLKRAMEDEKQRIHTSFLQTGTSTGRLSSKEPNLQNIPVRTEFGRKIRSGFIAKDGFKLVGIDYSQIELRLLAHFSEDKELIKSFINDKDIHFETAIKLFGESEASNKRNIAKSINFGLIYGMGARKLSSAINVSQAEAKGYIESYFNLFPTVKDYLVSIENQAKNSGYITTLIGRRRNFDFSNANPMQVASYSREAVNAVFQGSAADLIKLAMNKIFDEIIDTNAKLLLQIHDELIFEVKDEYAEEFSNKASYIMKNIYKLNVPLKTAVNIGTNWGELK